MQKGCLVNETAFFLCAGLKSSILQTNVCAGLKTSILQTDGVPKGLIYQFTKQRLQPPNRFYTGGSLALRHPTVSRLEDI
jgi:hypothetical protein